MRATRIFFSYSWEDKELARSIAADLKDKANQVWIDHNETRGGDNLTERISAALDWCDILVLLWTKSAQQSEWVKLEWTSAVALRKRIIPCVMGDVKLPAILASTLSVDFSDCNTRLANLKHALADSRSFTEVVTSPGASLVIETAIEDIIDVASTLEKKRPTPLSTQNVQSAHFDDGLDELVAAMERMLNQRSSQIGSGDSLYGSPIVQSETSNMKETEKARIVRSLLIRLSKLQTYRERVPVALILFGILEKDVNAGDIAYSRANRDIWIEHLRDLGVAKDIPLQEVVDILGAVYYDCWV